MFKNNHVVNPLADGYFSDKKAWKLYLKRVKSFLEELKNPFEKIEIGDRIEVYIPDRNPDGTRKTTHVDIEEILVSFGLPYDVLFSKSILVRAVNLQCFKIHEILDDMLTLNITGRYVDPLATNFDFLGYFNAIEIVGRVD